MTPAEQARALLASLPEGASPPPWHGDRTDGTVKYDVLDGNGDIVIHGDNANSGSDEPYGIQEPVGSFESNEKMILASPSLRDHLTAALDREARLRAILAECAMAVGDVQISDADANDLYRRIKAALASGDSDGR
jgi:hypothetical protein